MQAIRFLLGGVGGRRKNDGDLEEGSQRELGWYAAAAALSHRLEHACLCIERPKEISALGALKRAFGLSLGQGSAHINFFRLWHSQVPCSCRASEWRHRRRDLSSGGCCSRCAAGFEFRLLRHGLSPSRPGLRLRALLHRHAYTHACRHVYRHVPAAIASFLADAKKKQKE